MSELRKAWVLRSLVPAGECNQTCTYLHFCFRKPPPLLGGATSALIGTDTVLEKTHSDRPNEWPVTLILEPDPASQHSCTLCLEPCRRNASIFFRDHVGKPGHIGLTLPPPVQGEGVFTPFLLNFPVPLEVSGGEGSFVPLQDLRPNCVAAPPQTPALDWGVPPIELPWVSNEGAK